MKRKSRQQFKYDKNRIKSKNYEKKRNFKKIKIKQLLKIYTSKNITSKQQNYEDIHMSI